MKINLTLNTEQENLIAEYLESENFGIDVYLDKGFYSYFTFTAKDKNKSDSEFTIVTSDDGYIIEAHYNNVGLSVCCFGEIIDRPDDFYCSTCKTPLSV